MPNIITTEQLKDSIRRTVANRKRLAATVQDAAARRLVDIEDEGETLGSIPDVDLGSDRTF